MCYLLNKKNVASVIFILSSLFFKSNDCLSQLNNNFSNISEKSTNEWIEARSETGFIENKGQLKDINGSPVPFVFFKTESPGLNCWITETGITFQTFVIIEENEDENNTNKEVEKNGNKIKWEFFEVELIGASINRENIVAELTKEGRFNYFYENCPNGVHNVFEHQKVTIKEVYPGIDWVFYRKDGVLKYDFIVHANGDYQQIQLLYRSHQPISITQDGELEITTEYGSFMEKKPISFYNNSVIETAFVINDQKELRKDSHRLIETNISFDLKDFEGGQGDVIIDPEIAWGTFFGGNASEGIMGLDTDSEGNLFATGYTFSIDFPTIDLEEGNYFQGTTGGEWDILILKFNNDGGILWGTYYGGEGSDLGNSIVSNVDGDIFVTGFTTSTSDDDFPLLDPGGGSFYQDYNSGGEGAFILKFNNDGSREWATFYGGNGKDEAFSICSDIYGNIFLTGFTSGVLFPVYDPGGDTYFDSSCTYPGEVFISKFNSEGHQLWSTYYGGPGGGGGEGHGICTDYNGNVYVTGRTVSSSFPVMDPGGDGYFDSTYDGGTGVAGESDAFILKFDNYGVRKWATYYGGNSFDAGHSISADPHGNIFVTGYTKASYLDFTNLDLFDPGGDTYFQESSGASDVFIAKFDSLCEMKWASYFGGSGEESYHGLVFDRVSNRLAINDSGEVYMSFTTESDDVPKFTTCHGGYADSTLSGHSDQFLVKFDNSGKPLWTTYIGGNGTDVRSPIAVDSDDNLFISGEWTRQSPFEGVMMPETYTLYSADDSYYDSTFNGGVDDSFFLKLTPSVVSYSQSQVNDTACNCSGVAIAEILNTSGPYEFNWSTFDSTITDSNIDTLTDLCIGEYWVEIEDNCNQKDTLYYSILDDCSLNVEILTDTICEGECLELIANVFYETGEVTYDWGDIGLEDDTVNVCPTYTTTYTLTAIDDSDTATAMSEVFVLPNPSVNIGLDTVICNTDSLLLNAENPTSNYGWQDGDTAQTYLVHEEGIYWVDVELNGCVTRDSISVSYGYADANLGKDTILCGKETLTLSPTTDFLDSIAWIDTILSLSFVVETPGIYWVEVTDTLGCKASDSVIVEYAYLNAFFEIQDTIDCRPLTTHFFDYSTSYLGSITEWNWNFGDGNASSVQNPVNSYDSTGVYEVSLLISDSIGCVSEFSREVQIIIHELPVAQFSYDPYPIIKNEPVYYTDSSTSAISWYWNLGNGKSSTEKNPITTYSENGIVKVVLTVTNEFECSDSTLILLEVPDTLIKHIPNVFTPNGDGVNDIFFFDFYGESVSDFYCIIVDRWGITKGTIDGITDSWDGTDLEGNRCSDGVYFFVYYGKTENNIILEGQGSVTLTRGQ